MGMSNVRSSRLKIRLSFSSSPKGHAMATLTRGLSIKEKKYAEEYAIRNLKMTIRIVAWVGW